MIGVDMRFQHPRQLPTLFPDKGNHPIGRAGIGSTRRIVEIQDGIDDRTGSAGRIAHQIADGVGRFVEKGGDVRRHVG